VGLDRPQPGQVGNRAVGRKADVQPPQAEDAARLLSAAMAEDPELGLFLRLAVMLGARRGELCALRWFDVDFDRGEVLIAGNVVRVPRQALVHKDTKTHAKRRVAVGAGTIELLRARRVASWSPCTPPAWPTRSAGNAPDWRPTQPNRGRRHHEPGSAHPGRHRRPYHRRAAHGVLRGHGRRRARRWPGHPRAVAARHRGPWPWPWRCRCWRPSG
jgi:integrase